MFQPSKEILEKYAMVMVDFALGNGQGIKKGDVVGIEYWLPARPLALEVYKRILQKGGKPFFFAKDDEATKILYDLGSDEQIEFWPKEFLKGYADVIDHRIALLADEDPKMFSEIDPRKLILSNKFKREYRSWLDAKEDAGKLSWTLCLYGTEKMASEAGLTLEEYWNQIIKACFLDKVDPIVKWKQVFTDMHELLEKVNSLKIQKLHVEAEKTDLWLTMGENRKFIGGSGHNIPSFEIFTSPDWRGTEGTIFFDYPLYRYGNILKDIQLTFKEGKVVEATASQNQDLLREMISSQENGDKIGEFSLTDKKFSKINHFMAETLYDENFGGEFGNTHLAVGKSYHDTYDGDFKHLTDANWSSLGFNDSGEHCDIMATTKRTVTATLADGSEKVIYKDGEFVI